MCIIITSFVILAIVNTTIRRKILTLFSLIIIFLSAFQLYLLDVIAYYSDNQFFNIIGQAGICIVILGFAIIAVTWKME